MTSTQPAPPLPTELTAFLQQFYPSSFFNKPTLTTHSESAPPRQPGTRPFVTLTYAQSLDGKISGAEGKQLKLSGDESMLLTHKLREMHDSILVGIGTVLNDDPQLNSRLPTLLPREYQPQPIILDSYLRTPPSCRLIRNYLNKLQPIPIVVGSTKLLEEMPYLDAELDEAGAEVASCPVDGVGRISLPHVLDDVVVGESVMVEGGASVINSFLSSGLVNQVIVTTAPITVGEGVSVEQLGTDWKQIAARQFGNDTVTVWRPAA